ncbi:MULTISPECIES: chorismate mutase [Reichenbachiella]|uniref:chorismate mutase n=1 Tax=Reichenbachiella agariperforans TaxID=156994 RepID=A0A1M6KQM8_REIAG|nr:MULTISPECIES: chorismate mutase [Reichenbachiella]MBU2913650.1 chorismate mutase [Reichenbachiella agariperforans]RJE74399.1 3-deoxy-7-phosphoheptulonate synthase [Reichenbachiella sp. MSK19-1]SHJ61235.1 3-deoxy-D-arabinoheptulosonate-7-phosphate synthase [Reichenbachiella agariperforans]
MKVNLTLSPLENWIEGLNAPLIIGGPCSAESEEQVLETARQIKANTNIQVLRAGIWKPRTRPGAFEGIGVVGLKWLEKAKAETGLLTAVEVANAEHVELALKFNVDILWVGARTTVNPFSVQEVADALKGHDVPVLVKNPINPDLQLWIGALERINQAGITKLGGIHRGFSAKSGSQYRNDPTWEIPIELKRIIPNLPIICDPSHIAGNRALIEPVSQKAFDMQMDGVMIETHIDPDNALSDAKQQITPKTLAGILDRLIIREANSEDVDFELRLKNLREKIDKIDNELLEVLAQRMQVAEEIAMHKKEHNITILQVGRYEEIMENRVKKGKDLLLQEQFVHDLYEMIHNNSIKRQTAIMNSGETKAENA